MELSGGDSLTADPAEAQERKSAPYVFHGQTTSLCETCLEPVPAKLVVVLTVTGIFTLFYFVIPGPLVAAAANAARSLF